MRPRWAQARPPQATPQRLLERSAAVDGDDPRHRLDALICCDAARWLAWPDRWPEGAAREQAVVAAAGRATGEGPAAELLRASVAARVAIRQATPDQPGEAAALIRALPAGYPLKSRWQHWRELALRTGSRAVWQDARRELQAELTSRGVPPSETLPALMGQLDLGRWRSDERLAAALRASASEHLTAAAAELTEGTIRRAVTAAVGRAQVLLGAETDGAQRLHQVAADLPVRSAPAATRLFSRPVPEAATWLRSAVERASLAQHAARDAVLQHAVIALFGFAARHRAGHVLSEALDPLPVRFERSDVTAYVLTAGALAWSICGCTWQAQDYVTGGLRLAARAPRRPLTVEAALNAAMWLAASPDLDAGELLREAVSRITGTGHLILSAELARLDLLAGDHDRAWEALNAVYRMGHLQRPDARPVVVMAVAGALLAGGHTAAGLDLIRRGLALDGRSSSLPARLALTATDDAPVRTDLLHSLRHDELGAEPAAAALHALQRAGETRLAEAAVEAAAQAVRRMSEPLPRLHAWLALSRHAVRATDHALNADVELAVSEEAERLLERFRADEPPRELA